MITLTKNAVEKILEIIEAEDIKHAIIRTKCMGGGCAGFQFDLSFDDKINELDEVFEQNGIKIICDYISLQYLDMASIDYIDGLIDSGFKFNVPSAKGSCGCGQSFNF